MITAVASGKGGTGKTTLAVALALAAPRPAQLLDCDVEEPNCHVFLQPEFTASQPVSIPVPEVDQSKCTVCGRCSEMCQYGAIACPETGPVVFPEMCHGCGGCALVCPTGAITEVGREIGVVETASVREGLEFVRGRLHVGNPMSPPLIRAVKERAAAGSTVIVDCPPGTSCPAVAAVRGSECVLLVTEPTPFGLHDLDLAVRMVRELDLDMPMGVVLNRSDSGDRRVHDYCREHRVEIVLELPEDRRIAEAGSEGRGLLDARPELEAELRGLLDRFAGRSS